MGLVVAKTDTADRLIPEHLDPGQHFGRPAFEPGLPDDFGLTGGRESAERHEAPDVGLVREGDRRDDERGDNRRATKPRPVCEHQ